MLNFTFKDLENCTREELIGKPSDLIINLFSKARLLPGWFTLDDFQYFYTLLKMQTFMDIQGDILEIGCFHGRSSAVLASCLEKNERLTLVDAFDLMTFENYQNPPTVEKFSSNFQKIMKNLDFSKIKIIKTLSKNLVLEKKENFRFIHIDGAHDEETVLHDLKLVHPTLKVKGLLVLDDYHHPDFPGVAKATDQFLKIYEKKYNILSDINRHGALGRKLYLFKTSN